MKKNLAAKVADLPVSTRRKTQKAAKIIVGDSARATSAAVSTGGLSGLIKSIEVDLDVRNNRVTTTDNGAITPSGTDDAVLDFFQIAGALRGKSESEITALFSRAYRSNPLLAVKAWFYYRDVREGQGERRTFRIILKWLAANHPQTVKANLANVPFFGRWDDLFELFGSTLEKDMMTLVNNQLASDLSAQSASLLAKWMPSENASSQEGKRQARAFAKFFGISPRNYRRVLVHLRDKLKIIETAMCEGKWGEINYEHVPSRASMIYRKAFGKHDQVRYAEYLGKVEKGEAKINTATLYPYDLVYRASQAADRTVDALWANLPNYLENAPGNRLVVADVSGSMTSGLGNVRPIDVCISLAIYLAERNEGLFKDYFITFSGNPSLQKVVGNTLAQKVQSLASADWAMNTNLQAVFDLVLNKAKQGRVPESEMPKQIILISDMQFDCATSANDRSNFETAKSKYKAAGYEMPQIVFWCVNGQAGQAPVRKSETNTVLASGFSPELMRNLLGDKSFTPFSYMLEVLGKERYNVVQV
jgi:hypothetical protein